MTTLKAKSLSNHEIVTLAVYLLGGDTMRIDHEDVAVKANELAPGRFTWRKYKNQINIKNISAFLWDARKPKNGGYLIGTDVDGWMLTEQGLKFVKANLGGLKSSTLGRNPLNPKERSLLRRERERLLATDAFAKFASNQGDAISLREAESFFRVDAYVTGDARAEKILRTKNRFADDAELGSLIKLLESKLSKGVGT
jgi:hypothetical protein